MVSREDVVFKGISEKGKLGSRFAAVVTVVVLTTDVHPDAEQMIRFVLFGEVIDPLVVEDRSRHAEQRKGAEDVRVFKGEQFCPERSAGEAADPPAFPFRAGVVVPVNPGDQVIQDGFPVSRKRKTEKVLVFPGSDDQKQRQVFLSNGFPHDLRGIHLLPYFVPHILPVEQVQYRVSSVNTAVHTWGNVNIKNQISVQRFGINDAVFDCRILAGAADSCCVQKRSTEEQKKHERAQKAFSHMSNSKANTGK